MTPAEAIASLEAQLDEHGQDIELQRIIAGPGGTQIVWGVTCRAIVRGYLPRELVQGAGTGITQQDRKIIMGFREINRWQWPGGTPAPAGKDKRIPVKGDRIVTDNGTLTVQAGAAIEIDNTPVRLELQARGVG